MRKPRSFSAVSARARFCTSTSGTSSSAPEADFASTPVASGLWRAVVTIAFTAKAAAERRMAPTLCGSVIWSSTSTMPSCFSVVDVGRGQGIGFRQHALVHGIGPEPLVDQLRAHDLRRDTGVDVLVGQPARSVLGQQQLSDIARRDWPAPRTPCASHRGSPARRGRTRGRARPAVAGRGPNFRPFSKDLPPPLRNGGFRSRSLMQGLCHGFRILAIWPVWRAWILGGFPWLTLRVRLPINAPDRAPLRRCGPSAISMVLSAAILGGRFADAVGTGECPEWQRELTVNQPSYDFAGSSPASPTTLRPGGLRVAQPRPARQGEACPA